MVSGKRNLIKRDYFKNENSIGNANIATLKALALAQNPANLFAWPQTISIALWKDCWHFDPKCFIFWKEKGYSSIIDFYHLMLKPNNCTTYTFYLLRYYWNKHHWTPRYVLLNISVPQKYFFTDSFKIQCVNFSHSFF